MISDYPTRPSLSLMSINARKPDFGSWLKPKLDDLNITIAEVSRRTGIAYPNVSATINSGKTGKPVQPEPETMRKIIPVLLDLGVIESEAEAWIAAGYEVDGYEVRPVKETELNTTPPENFEDWPLELRQALAHSKTLSRETQEYVYKLWLEDVVSHVDREARRQAATQKLIERQERIDREKLNKPADE